LENITKILIVLVLFIVMFILLILRESKKIERIVQEEIKVLKNEQNFSAIVKNNEVLTKNTEMVELEIKIPDGFKWALEVINNVDGSKRRIDSARFGDKSSRIAFKVKKGEDMTFVIKGKGRFGEEIIKIPYSS